MDDDGITLESDEEIDKWFDLVAEISEARELLVDAQDHVGLLLDYLMAAVSGEVFIDQDEYERLKTDHDFPEIVQGVEWQQRARRFLADD